MRDEIRKSLYDKAEKTLEFLGNKKNLDQIFDLAHSVHRCLDGGNKVLVCGNGGSAADAAHFAAEFTGRFKQGRRALPVMPITEPAYLTAIGNDFGIEELFSRQVEAFGQPGDLLICLSTSGMSINVNRAARVAFKQGMDVIALSGRGGGFLAEEVPLTLVCDGDDSATIQEIQMSVLHTLVEVVEKRFV